MRLNYLPKKIWFMPTYYHQRDVDYTSRPISFEHRIADYDHEMVSLAKVKIPRRSRSTNSTRIYKKKLALLLPGHNEELIIQTTIKSAVAAGQPIRDIFVVDDNSDDKTRELAIELLGESQVLTVPRSGKAGAVFAAMEYFHVVDRYRWLHVADADSIFGENYFKIYRKAINNTKCTVAVGFVQSLRGNWISHYRSFTYTFSQHVIRRAQSWLGLIAVFPGPITAFRTDILKDLNFLNDTITEDFDVTLQFHRKKLGKILYIPEAVNYTQDPQSFIDFCKQTARWQRGFFQGVRQYRIGTKLQKIDISIGYQMLEMILYFIQVFVLLPLIVIETHKWIAIPVMIIGDMFVVSLAAIFSSAVIKRINVLASMPYFYFLRWVEISIFVSAFFEIIVFKKFQSKVIGWQTEGRRYALDAVALKDVAK